MPVSIRGRLEAGAPSRDDRASNAHDAIAHVPKGWHSRGYLPHLDAGEIVQMVTFRLADSFPHQMLALWADELAHLPRDEVTTEQYRRIERYIDRGAGEAWLRDERIASLVQDALLYFDGERYHLHAWVVMPNHVHALVTTADSHGLPGIVHSWKSYTANRANRLLKRQGDFWHRDYYDRYIRDDRHYATAVAYIEANPVRAKLCACVNEWTFSSVRFRG